MRRLFRFQGGHDVHALRRRDLAVSLGTVADQQHPDDHHNKGGATWWNTTQPGMVFVKRYSGRERLLLRGKVE